MRIGSLLVSHLLVPPFRLRVQHVGLGGIDTGRQGTRNYRQYAVQLIHFATVGLHNMMVDSRVMTDTSTDQLPEQRKAQAKQAAHEGSLTGTEHSMGEALSALVDGEASELEVRRVIRAAESDPEILVRWQRLQVARAVMKGEHSDFRFDVSASVRAAIDAEPPLGSQGEAADAKPARVKRWGEGAGKVAVAASVAIAFVVGVQQLGPVSDPAAVQTADAALPATQTATAGLNSAPSGFELPAFSARTVSAQQAPSWSVKPQASGVPAQAELEMQLQTNQALQNHFESMLFKHAERSSSAGGMGLLPFARVSRLESAAEEPAVEGSASGDVAPE